MPEKIKSVFINIGICFVSTTLFVLVMELVFPKILHKLPLSFYVSLGKDYKILGQYHKKSVIPTDYVALVGDSHALGSGDWYLEAVKKHKLTQGAYHSAHILFKETGRDILSFGALGSGSLRGLVLKPVSYFKYLNSLRGFKLEPPEEILVYFFEGNDLSDNAYAIHKTFSAGYDMGRLYDPEYFKTFIEKELLGTDPLYMGKVPFKNWLFSRFLVESVSDNVYNEVKRGINKLKIFFSRLLETTQAQAEGVRVSLDFSNNVSETNSDIALVDGKEFLFPHSTQQPGLNLNEEQNKQAFYVFEQSLRYMAGYFNGAKITIVYIPSPVSVYNWISPKITILVPRGKLKFTPREIYQRSDKIFKHIEAVSRKYNFALIDTRLPLRSAALKEPVHGPRDWYHPNRKGYEVIAGEILKNTGFGK